MLKKACFWRLVPDDVIETPAEFTNADMGFVSRVKKDKMEVATGRTWPNFEWSLRALHTRDYVPKDFGQKFVDDRPFESDVINKHAHVQSKAGFSYAMTVMDVVNGWEDEETWVASKFAACMWNDIKCVLCVGRESTQETQ